MSIDQTNRPQPLWLKAAYGLVFSACIAATTWMMYRAYVSYVRRTATISSLREEVAMWQRHESKYGRMVAKDVEDAIDSLAEWRIKEIDESQLYTAYISPAGPMHPDDAPILTLEWLENGFEVDGFDLYVDGKLEATVTGWKQQNVKQQEELKKLFGNRYDRYIFVDIPTDPRNVSTTVRQLFEVR